MKRIALFSITLLFFFNHALQAQTLELGVSLGVSMAKISWSKNSYYSRGAYTAEPSLNAGLEMSYITRSGFGARAGLLYFARAVSSDSVNTYPSQLLEYHSVVEANASTLFIPLQACYRAPFGKFYAQLSAGVMPGFLLDADVNETIVRKSNFPVLYEPAVMDYSLKFELGIVGEARLAYQVTPKIGIGINVLYLRSEIDIEIDPDFSIRELSDQYTQGLAYSLSAHFKL
jgi:hypothetical protein